MAPASGACRKSATRPSCHSGRAPVAEAERGVEGIAVVFESSLRVTACPYPLQSPTSSSPKDDTELSEQTRACNQTRAGGELPRVETQSGLAQASLATGPLGLLPFHFRSAPRVVNPRRHLDGPTWRSTGLRRISRVSLRRAHRRSSALGSKAVLHYPARPRGPASTCFTRGQLTECQTSSITRSHREARARPLPETRLHSCCASPFVVTP